MSHRSKLWLQSPGRIVTTRIYEAPIALVWKAFTEPGCPENWWGPQGFTTTTAQMDVREGGEWRHTMIGPDGTRFPNLIRYTSVQPQSLLAWDHSDGTNPVLFRARVQFQALGEQRTLLTLTHHFASDAARDENIRRYGSTQGAIDTTDRLAAYLVSRPGERDFIVTRDFACSRAALWSAWTDARHLAAWWGPPMFSNTHCEIDARVGGTWAVTMSGPFPGPEVTHYPITGEVLEVVPEERLVMTMDCAGHPRFWHDLVKPGRSAEETNPAGTILMTVTFEPRDGGARLTVRETMVSAEVLERMKAMNMEQGWSLSFDRLASLAVTLQKA